MNMGSGQKKDIFPQGIPSLNGIMKISLLNYGINTNLQLRRRNILEFIPFSILQNSTSGTTSNERGSPSSHSILVTMGKGFEALGVSPVALLLIQTLKPLMISLKKLEFPKPLKGLVAPKIKRIPIRCRN